MIFMYILSSVIVVALAIVIAILSKKLSEKQQIDRIELDNFNKEKEQLQNDIKRLKNDTQSYNDNLNSLKQTISILKNDKENLIENLNNLDEQQRVAAESIFSLAKQNAEQAFDNEIEKINEELESNRAAAKQEYAKTLKELVENFQRETAAASSALENLKQTLSETRIIVDSAVAERKRAAEIETKNDFYKLQLSQEDIEEIKKLREVLPYLRDKEPLNKVIYKVYYEKPYTDLVGRVIGQGRHTGIYKITNITNGMCYVGQAVDLRERWRQHIKRGVGADPPTRNKLYPAMLAFGVENFTFEIIEECSEAELNNKEQFWQEYFHTKDFGYSIK